MTLKLALQLKTASAIWQKAVKSFSLLSARLVRVVPMVVGGQSRGWVKAVFHFTRLVMRIRRNQGSRGLALFLKANSLLFMRVLAGSKLVNPREAGVAVSTTRRGVPRWVPVLHRRQLLAGNRGVIRLYLGFCTLYRALDFKGKLSLSTITAPGKDITAIRSEFADFVAIWIRWALRFGIKPYLGVRDREDSEFWGQPGGLRGAIRFIAFTPVWKWMFTSGPNSKYTKVLAVGNGWTDMLAIISRPWLHGLLDHWRAFVGDGPLEWMPWFKNAEQALENWETTCAKAQSRPRESNREKWEPQGDVGSLSIVEEPGKKRIVAMVDIWTQWALYPLHRWLYKNLGKIPQDGTFDQTKPVKALLEKAKSSGREHFWSFDLSAATDRLPVAVQISVLGILTHLGFAHTWAELLTDRLYRTPKEYATTLGKGASHVKYAVGQPMGAYSSWAMLAMTHHALVQFAAWRVGHRSWFTWYAVLGDDIVICDKDVADSYVRVMDGLGVKIGFHKSIVSTNSSLEFAKRFYYKGEEVTPLSLGGIAVGWLGPGFIPEVVASSEARTGVTLSLYQIARFMGVGFRAASAAVSRPLSSLPRILSSSLLLLSRPGAPRGVRNLVTWYTSNNMEGKRGKIRVSQEEAIFEAVWTEAVDGVLAPALKRVKSVARGIVIPSNGKRVPEKQTHPLGTPESGPYHAWFDGLIIPSFVKKWRKDIDRAGEKLREAKKAWSKEGSLLKALRLIEDALSILAKIPTRANIVRRPDEEIPISESVLRGVLAPRSVKRWNTVARLRGAKSTCRQGPITRKGHKGFSGKTAPKPK